LRVITFLFGGVCHQIADRCLVYDGRALPLCARCTGTFLGFMLALIVLRLIERGRPSGLPTGRTLALLAGLAGLWTADGINSFVHLARGQALYQPSSTLRLLTGIGFGLGLGTLLYPITQGVMWHNTEERPVLNRRWQRVVLLAAGGALAALILLWRAAPWWLWLLLVSIATLSTLATANGTLLVLLLRRESRGERWWQMLPWLALGAGMALAEMAALATLRAAL